MLSLHQISRILLSRVITKQVWAMILANQTLWIIISLTQTTTLTMNQQASTTWSRSRVLPNEWDRRANLQERHQRLIDQTFKWAASKQFFSLSSTLPVMLVINTIKLHHRRSIRPKNHSSSIIVSPLLSLNWNMHSRVKPWIKPSPVPCSDKAQLDRSRSVN